MAQASKRDLLLSMLQNVEEMELRKAISYSGVQLFRGLDMTNSKNYAEYIMMLTPQMTDDQVKLIFKELVKIKLKREREKKCLEERKKIKQSKS